MTTPTTQREADERALYERTISKREQNYDAWRVWQARAAIDQSTRQAEPVVLHDSASSLIKARITAATDQPSAGQVNCVRCDGDPCGSNNPCTVCGRASLTPTAPAEGNVGWAHELQKRLMVADDQGDDDLHNLLGEVACCLAALTGRPDTALTPTAPQAASQQAEIEEPCDLCFAPFGKYGCDCLAPQAATTASASGCTRCGSTEIHACPGEPIPEWTPEAIAEFNNILSEYETEPAPVQAAQPATPAGFSITDAELGAIDNAISHLVGSHELPVTTGILDALSKRGWAYLAAPGAAQTTVAREGGA